jgi:hypothetical protein
MGKRFGVDMNHTQTLTQMRKDYTHAPNTAMFNALDYAIEAIQERDRLKAMVEAAAYIEYPNHAIYHNEGWQLFDKETRKFTDVDSPIAAFEAIQEVK